LSRSGRPWIQYAKQETNIERNIITEDESKDIQAKLEIRTFKLLRGSAKTAGVSHWVLRSWS
jgi:hypothetical protein